MELLGSGPIYLVGTGWFVTLVALSYWVMGLRSKMVALRGQGEHLEGELKGAQSALLDAHSQMAALRESLGELKAENAQLKSRREEDLAFYKDSEERLTTHFRAIAGESLKGSSDSFLAMAESLLKRYRDDAKGQAQLTQQEFSSLITPIKTSLGQVDLKIGELEKSRVGAYQSLKSRVDHLLEAQSGWHKEASKLSQALLSPVSKGQWGEIQLRRVVELAGMVSYCDFYEQSSETGEEGKRLRPDMLIRLPGERQIILDAKAPLNAYFAAVEADSEEECIKGMRLHAEQVKKQIALLSQKSYWTQFKPTPEFVILFMPAEHFYSTALQADASLLEYSAEKKVIVATPTILIALLKSIAFGWKQADLAANAKQISLLGHEMYERMCDYTAHVGEVGRGLKLALESYNKSIGTLESRVLSTAKKFKKYGVDGGKKSLKPPREMALSPRTFKKSVLEEFGLD